MRAGWRGLVFAVVVIGAAAVALWPSTRPHDLSIPGPGLTHPGVGDVNAGDLARLAARADLMPCPSPAAATSPTGQLAGVLAPCLGTTLKLDIGAALAGQPTLINFWASWCKPCREEMPLLAAYSEEPGAVRVVGINVQDSQTAALSLLPDLDVHYPSFADADAVGQVLGAPPVLPLSYLVDTDGAVRRISSPLVFRNVEQVRAAVAALQVRRE